MLQDMSSVASSALVGAKLDELSNINSRIFAEDEAEASASALQPCLHHLKCHNLNKNAIFRGFYP